MSVVGSAFSRQWGECLWTAPDLLKQPVAGAVVTILAGSRFVEPPPRVVLVPVVPEAWIRA